VDGIDIFSVVNADAIPNCNRVRKKAPDPVGNPH